MLRVDPDDRLGAIEALNHDFFMIDRKTLAEIEFKLVNTKKLENFWNTVQLKN